MSKPVRFVLNMAAAFAVLLLVPTCGLWVWSYTSKPTVMWVIGSYGFVTWSGSFRVFRVAGGRSPGPIIEFRYELVCLILGTLAVFLFTQAERLRRLELKRRRLCSACGCTMPGRPGRCPECGMVVTTGRV